MVALRHAARRLCERALQQRGALAKSTVAAEESPGRRLMITTISRKPSSSTAGPQAELERQFKKKKDAELERQFKKKKEELFDMIIAVRRAEVYPQLSWEDIKMHRLVTQLAAQVEPRPHDPNWSRYRGTRRLNDFTSIYTFVGFFGMLSFNVFNKEEDGAKNNESTVVSDGEPKNDMN